MVVGGSVAGLATASALAQRGVPVRVLERSAPPPDGPPVEVAASWRRPTVPQGGHSHILNSLGVRVLRRSAPRVLEEALEQGAALVDLTPAAPHAGAGGGRDGRGVEDPDLVALAVRRTLLELLLRRATQAAAHVTLEHCTSVRGLLLDASGTRAAGVVTEGGTQVPARFVVDATGRRAASVSWLRRAELAPGDDLVGPTELRGFTRFYRLRAPCGAWPGELNRGNSAGGIWDHYAAVAHPADNGTFALVLAVPTGDRALNSLRHPGAFTTAARLSPHVAEWVDEGAAYPVTNVRAITVPPNILRATARSAGERLAGLYPVGDAACVTDPLYGRGLSLALAHAFRLAALLDEHPSVGEEQSVRATELAERVYGPWFEQAVHDSAARARRWRAHAGGTTAPVEPAAAPPGRPSMAEVAHAAATDPAVWHGLTRLLMGLRTPADVLDAPAFRERVRAAGPALGGRPSGPSRAALVDALAGVAEV